MTNEELKKKIVEVVRNSEITGIKIRDIMGGYSMANNIADDLIAAGIGDVSCLREHRVIAEYSFVPDDDNPYIIPNVLLRVVQLYSGEEVEQIVKEREEYKYRAEVAEKAGRIIQRDMARVFDVSNPRICELIANIWDLAKKQAEKELAEEKKE